MNSAWLYNRNRIMRQQSEEQLQLQMLLLLNEDASTIISLGGTSTTNSSPDVITSRQFAYNDGQNIVNFAGTYNYFDVKAAYTTALNNGWNILGESVRSFVPVAVGVQLYTFTTQLPNTTPGNYVINSNQIMAVNSSGIVTAIVNFADI